MLSVWLISAPFATMAAVSSSAPLNRLLARVHWLILPLGWAALFTITTNLVVLGDSRSAPALWIAAPLAGLAIWVRGRGDDDWPDSDPEPEPDGGPGLTVRYEQARHRVTPPAPRVRGQRRAARRRRTRVT